MIQYIKEATSPKVSIKGNSILTFANLDSVSDPAIPVTENSENSNVVESHHAGVSAPQTTGISGTTSVQSHNTSNLSENANLNYSYSAPHPPKVN